jgi:hypothetical protein
MPSFGAPPPVHFGQPVPDGAPGPLAGAAMPGLLQQLLGGQGGLPTPGNEPGGLNSLLALLRGRARPQNAMPTLADLGSANGATGSGGDSTGGVSGTGGVGGSAEGSVGGSAAAGVGGDDGGTY